MRARAHLTGSRNYFEDFSVGDRYRHVRAKTVGEFENQILTHLVMNTAQAHFNEEGMRHSPWGQRLVFGLVTASIVVGLATQDTAENALAELTLDELRFVHPVFHGDTLSAYSEVFAKEDHERPDAGVVAFRHWGFNQNERMVFHCGRRVLVRRRHPLESAPSS